MKPIIIDAHAHLGYWPTLASAKKDLLYSTTKNKVDFTLFSFDGTEVTDNQNAKLIPQLLAAKKALAFTKAHKENFGFLIWCRPRLEKNIEELDTFIKKHRDFIYGLKFHPYTSRMKITDPRNYRYFDLARKYKLPILVHTANDKYSKLMYLERVSKKFPELTFIAAHCELLTDHEYTINVLKENPNIYCDTAWVDINFILKLKENNLIDRVMFGTDNPIDGKDTLDEEIYQNYFNNSINLNEEDYKKLMGENAIKLFNIKINQ